MELVDKDDDLPLRLLDLAQHRFQSLLKFTAILCPGKHRPEIKTDQPLVSQCLRHIARDYPLGQPLDDRRLSDSRLTNQNRIVLRSPGENLDRPPDLIITPDHRIELTLACQLRQIPRILRERLIALLCVLRRDASAGAHSRNHLQQNLATDRVLPHYPARLALPVLDNPEQQMLRRDILILKPVRLLLCTLKDLSQTRPIIPLRRSAHLRKLSKRRLRLTKNYIGVRPGLAQHWSCNPLRLLEQCDQQMLGLDILVTPRLGHSHRRLDRFL